MRLRPPPETARGVIHKGWCWCRALPRAPRPVRSDPRGSGSTEKKWERPPLVREVARERPIRGSGCPRGVRKTALFRPIEDYRRLTARAVLERSQPLRCNGFPCHARAAGRWALTDSNRRPLPCKGRSGVLTGPDRAWHIRRYLLWLNGFRCSLTRVASRTISPFRGPRADQAWSKPCAGARATRVARRRMRSCSGC